MKMPLLKIPILCALLLLPSHAVLAADRTEPASELEALVAKIQAKLTEGNRSAAALTNELKEFDLLLARHQGERTDAVAQILVEEAGFYLKVLEDFDKATQLIERLKREFPQTTPGRNADKLLASIARHAEAKRLLAVFVVGSTLPDFDERDLNRRSISITQYRGKVVLLDFGAMWSKPWVAELPNLRRVYKAHHREGFEIIGVSLDHDQLKLSGFARRYGISWPQFFDGRGWNNKLAVKYGVRSLPANYLLDGEGKIVARNLHGQALEDAVAKTVGRKMPR